MSKVVTYGVAVVPEVKDLEGNGRLSTLARLERFAGVEDCRAELQGSYVSVRLPCYARNRGALACQPCRLQADRHGCKANPWTGYHTYRNVLVDSAGTVDQLNDRVGVVDEVGGQGLVGEGIAVGRDEGLEVVGDFARIGVAHAVGGGTPVAPGSGGCGCSKRNSCEGENRTHVGGDGGDVGL